MTRHAQEAHQTLLFGLDKRLKRRVIVEGLQIYLLDNQLAWEMDSEGNYRPRRGVRKSLRNAQNELIEMLK